MKYRQTITVVLALLVARLAGAASSNEVASTPSPAEPPTLELGPRRAVPIAQIQIWLVTPCDIQSIGAVKILLGVASVVPVDVIAVTPLGGVIG